MTAHRVKVSREFFSGGGYSDSEGDLPVELDAGLRRFLASCQGRYYAWYDDGYDDEESLFLPVLWGDSVIVFEDIIDATKCKLLFT